MAEAKSRRDTNFIRTRPRPKPELSHGDGAQENSGLRPEEAFAADVPSGANDNEFVGYDEEINNRYEEIKRGGTHISELQHMTMPQLLKTAKEEGITDYTGLKKQDLIFKILKER